MTLNGGTETRNVTARISTPVGCITVPFCALIRIGVARQSCRFPQYTQNRTPPQDIYRLPPGNLGACAGASTRIEYSATDLPMQKSVEFTALRQTLHRKSVFLLVLVLTGSV